MKGANWRVKFTIGVIMLALVGVAALIAKFDQQPDNQAGQATASASTPTVTSPTAEAHEGGSAGGSLGERAKFSRKVFKLADHPLLQDPTAGLASQDCVLPPWRSSQGGAEAFFNAAKTCLDQAWQPVLAQHRLPFQSPELHFPAGNNFPTECGTIKVSISTAAYYCESSLFIPFKGLQTTQYGNSPGVYLALFAHEYGHHVQELAGLMDAAWDDIYAAGQKSPAGQEMARRKELQAQCFSGMFLGSHMGRGSISKEMYEKAWRDQENRGDDTSRSRDHGTNEHYAGWWRTGAQHNKLAQCNTFTAPATAVS